MGFYVVAHQPTPRRLLAAQRRRSIFLAVPLRLGPPSAQIFCSFIYSRSVALRLGPRVGSSARRRRPATEGQSQARRRRRRLPLPPLASRLAPSPPSSAHRPATLRTHLPLPSRLCCTVGARPAAQGGRALAPPVPMSFYCDRPYLISNCGFGTSMWLNGLHCNAFNLL